MIAKPQKWRLLGIRTRRNERNTKHEGVDLIVVRPSGTLVTVPLTDEDLLRLIIEAADHLKAAKAINER